MFQVDIISRFGLVLQHKESPDGYPVYVAENLSRNGPTVFFELLILNDSDDLNLPLVRITKAGAINHIIVSQRDLGAQSFTDLQQAIEKTLDIPE
jgi:predicted YcjX-like family ATPase